MLKTNLLVALLVASAFISKDVMPENCPSDVALFINASSELEGLKGSCLQIPCTFKPEPGKDFNNSADVFGVWIKNNTDFAKNQQNVVFNNSNSKKNVYPMNFTGNLMKRDCSTLFSGMNQSHADTYYFRVEMKGFVATASCDPIKITVRETPWQPTLVIPEDLREKVSVNVSCSAPTPCPHSPPKLSWSLCQDAVSTTEENPDRTLTTKIQEEITLSDRDDGRNVSCSSSYSVDGGEKTSEAAVTLSVSYAPKDTSASISPSEPVSAGSFVNLTCSSRAKPAVTKFTWFRISTDGASRVSEGELYSFNVSQGGAYYCVAINDLGNQTSNHIVLSVTGDPRSFPLWGVALGGGCGILALLMLTCVWCLISKHSSKAKLQTPTGEEMTADKSTNEINTVEDNIHYGEIDFSRWNPEPSSGSMQGVPRPLDTVYAEVKREEVNSDKTENASTEAVESLYAEVMKTGKTS